MSLPPRSRPQAQTDRAQVELLRDLAPAACSFVTSSHAARGARSRPPEPGVVWKPSTQAELARRDASAREIADALPEHVPQRATAQHRPLLRNLRRREIGLAHDVGVVRHLPPPIPSPSPPCRGHLNGVAGFAPRAARVWTWWSERRRGSARRGPWRERVGPVELVLGRRSSAGCSRSTSSLCRRSGWPGRTRPRGRRARAACRPASAGCTCTDDRFRPQRARTAAGEMKFAAAAITPGRATPAERHRAVGEVDPERSLAGNCARAASAQVWSSRKCRASGERDGRELLHDPALKT